MWEMLHALCLPAGLLLVLFCFSRAIAAIFSDESRNYLRKRPITHGLLALLAPALIVLGLFPSIQMKNQLNRSSQREFVVGRVAENGGWSAFKKDCQLVLLEAKARHQGQWFPGVEEGRILERYRVIDSLNPLKFQAVTSSNQPSYLILTLFDNSGGRHAFFYGLVYQETTNSDKCLAGHLFHRVTPKRIVDSVFKVY